jgi:hypothetical protein
MNGIIKKIIIASVFCLIFGIRSSAQAAVLSFEPATATFRPNREIEVRVLLNTESESLNAVEANIAYPTNLLQFIDASDANSALNLWMQRPEEKNGKISFAGVIPGGYKGGKGLLCTLIFKTIKEGSGSIALINKTSVLKNDGNGTEARLVIKKFNFKIQELGDNYPYTGADYQPAYLNDTQPPEIFSPQISRDSGMFEGKWFVAFNTQDKQSGIDHFEVQENRSNKPDYSKWKTVASPYLLEDQNLKSYIFVKAVDKAGNSVLEILPPKYEKKGISAIWLVELGIILFIIFLYYIKKRVDR